MKEIKSKEEENKMLRRRKSLRTKRKKRMIKKKRKEKKDSSQTEFEGSPIVPRKMGHEYALRRREMRSKFKNTMETALELSPSPTPSPSTPRHTTPPPSPL